MSVCVNESVHASAYACEVRQGPIVSLKTVLHYNHGRSRTYQDSKFCCLDAFFGNRIN